MTSKIMTIHALSPLHAGTGQSTGAIDLAIARNRATGVPLLPGSSIKGALRARALGPAADQPSPHRDLFGPETKNASDGAGAMVFGDAELLLLPVRSLRGTFAWVTSPWLISRHNRDCRAAGLAPLVAPRASANQCVVGSDTTVIRHQNKVYLEELDLIVSRAQEAGRCGRATATALAQTVFPDSESWQTVLQNKLVFVHDDVMAFLWRYATQIDARIAMDHDLGTVRDGGLWHEESLPPETVLTSLVTYAPTRQTNTGEDAMWRQLRDASEGWLQLGGKATVGRGRCQITWSHGNAGGAA